MKKTSLAVAALLSTLSMATVIPAAYADDAVMTPPASSTCQGCKGCAGETGCTGCKGCSGSKEASGCAGASSCSGCSGS